MEDQQIKCPVCDSNITGNYCKTCGFPVRRVFVPLPDALQEEEQKRINIAKQRWNLFLEKDGKIESLEKEKETLAKVVEEANKKTEEAKKTIGEKEDIIAQRNAEIESLQNKTKTLEEKKKQLEEEKKQLEEEKKQIEKNKDEKIGELNARINQLRKELEKIKKDPKPVSTSTCVAPIGHLVQQEDEEIIGVYPIFAGKTILGKAPRKQNDVNTCMIKSSEQKLEEEHFIIEAGDNKDKKTQPKAILSNGTWCIDSPNSKSPKEIELSNSTTIIIGDLYLIFIC